MRAAVLLLVFAAPACGGPVLTSPTPPATVAAAQAAAARMPYAVAPGDTLEIRHQTAEELNATVLVLPDGTVVLPLIGAVAAAGQTPAALGPEIARRYAGFVRTPQVTVIVHDTPARKVFVGGEVANPGGFDLLTGQTVSQAVFAAGGFKDTARRGEVIVMRRGSPRPLTFAVDFTRIASGAEPGADAALQPMDVVFVPKSGIADLDLAFQQYVRALLPLQPGLGLQFH